MLADLTRVIAEARGARLLVRSLDGLEVGLKRSLGVDDDVLPAGKLDDEVGPDAAVIDACGHLLDEVAVGEHARHLDHAAELDLAPATSHGRRAERRDEIAGLGAQALLRLRERPHLAEEGAVGLGPRPLEVLDLAVDLDEGLLDRRHEVLDGQPALIEIVLRLRLEPLEGRPGELEERRVVRLERLG